MVTKQSIIMQILISPKCTYANKNKHMYSLKSMKFFVPKVLAKKINYLKNKKQFKLLEDIVNIHNDKFIINFGVS